MKITVAIDSLKGSLASMEAGNAAKGGILRVYPEAEVFVRPLADGGDVRFHPAGELQPGGQQGRHQPDHHQRG